MKNIYYRIAFVMQTVVARVKKKFRDFECKSIMIN
jgi:hypothetical protein